tara:strand:- start:1200 stop:1766 length:567 start_codon:yes stop_codon:yes gene_type:complete
MRNDLDLSALPLQRELVESAVTAFQPQEDVIAAVLLGSLAGGRGDRVSDADIIVFTKNNFHTTDAQSCYEQFEYGKEIFYKLAGFHNDNACFKKYIFTDLTSAEIHCVDLAEEFSISKPFIVLFDKSNIVEGRLTDEPAPKHENFPVYTNGDEGLIWELFDCIKWASRDNHQLVKSYIKKLAHKLDTQ